MEQPQHQGLTIAHKPHMKVCHTTHTYNHICIYIYFWWYLHIYIHMLFIYAIHSIGIYYLYVYSCTYLFDVFVFCWFGSQMSLRLSPVVSPSLDFLSEDWRTETMWKAVTWCRGQGSTFHQLDAGWGPEEDGSPKLYPGRVGVENSTYRGLLEPLTGDGPSNLSIEGDNFKANLFVWDWKQIKA